MNKVRLEVHPDSANAHAQNPSSRPSRVEILARGQTFAGERLYPKGTPSPQPETFMTTDELVRKFRSYLDGLVAAATIDSVADSILNLERVADFSSVMRALVWVKDVRR